MTRVSTVAAALMLCALPSLAQEAAPEAATDAQKAALSEAIAANDCRVTAENNSAILEAAGLAEADAATVVQALLEAGEAVIEGGELVLQSDACAE